MTRGEDPVRYRKAKKTKTKTKNKTKQNKTKQNKTKQKNTSSTILFLSEKYYNSMGSLSRLKVMFLDLISVA